MKKIEPGVPCIIKGSLFNDGRIVTPVKFLGKRVLINPDGSLIARLCWEIAEELARARSYPFRVSPETNVCEQRVMFPLDNPGDDEVDEISKVRLTPVQLEYQE